VIEDCNSKCDVNWFSCVVICAFDKTLSNTICGAGTSLMDKVFVNQEASPYVLEENGTLDLAELQLQPASIVINRSVATATNHFTLAG